MSLDIHLTAVRPCVVFDYNITHNLGRMADAAGLYKVMWEPEEIGVITAEQALPILEAGLAELKSDPSKFKAFNPTNGWGSYDGLVKCVEDYIEACRENTDARIEVFR